MRRLLRRSGLVGRHWHYPWQRLMALLGHSVATRHPNTRRKIMRRIACARGGSTVWWVGKLVAQGVGWVVGMGSLCPCHALARRLKFATAKTSSKQFLPLTKQPPRDFVTANAPGNGWRGWGRGPANGFGIVEGSVFLVRFSVFLKANLRKFWEDQK